MLKATLKAKLLFIGILATAIPLLVISVLNWRQSLRTEGIARSGTEELAYADLDHLVTSIRATCELMAGSLQHRLDTDLAVLDDDIAHSGGIRFSADEMIDWNAINQATKQAQSVK